MTHATWEQIVDYVAGDGEEIEEHLMGCAACVAHAESAMRITRAIRGTLPPVVTEAQIDALPGLVIEHTTFTPGTRTEVAFKPGVDLLIHHLAGLDLADAERVHLMVRVESTGALIVDDHFAPFDPARGEILIACQRHFSVFPPDIQFDVQVHRRASPPVVATYFIPHVFA